MTGGTEQVMSFMYKGYLVEQVLEVVDEYFKHFKPKIQRAGLKKPYYIIQNVIDRTLYWSNKWGWGSKQGCYKTKDIVGVHLPVEGQWVLERI